MTNGRISFSIQSQQIEFNYELKENEMRQEEQTEIWKKIATMMIKP